MEPKTLAPYVLKVLAGYQINGRLATLQTLVDELRVRRSDLRKTVTALDAEGYLDAMRMTLTMAGFAVGAGLVERELPPLRQSRKLTLIAA